MKEKKKQQEGAEVIMETYHYYGDVVSAHQIGGKEVMLHPGQEVSLDMNDDTVKSLVAQGLLVKYAQEKKKIWGKGDDTEVVEQQSNRAAEQ